MYGRIPYLNNSWSSWATHCFYLSRLSHSTRARSGAAPCCTLTKRGQLFLNFEDKNQKVIKPTYAKGGSWLPSIGFTNSLCARFTRMTTGHAPIGEYRQRFFPHLPISYLCGKAEVQTQEHIIMECDTHDPSTRPCNIIINSFVHFLVDNPSAFSFDNSWYKGTSRVVLSKFWGSVLLMA